MRRRTATRSPWCVLQRDQCDALREPSFNFMRDIAPVGGISRSPGHGGASFGSGQVGARIDRLRQSQPPQAQHGVARDRHREPHCRRAFQDDGRHQYDYVPYRGAGPMLTDLIAGQVQFIFGPLSHRSGISRPASCARSECQPRRALRIARPPERGGFVPGYEATNWALGAPRNTPPRSSTSLTWRSMRASPIPGSKRGSPIWAAPLPGSPAELAGSSPTKLRNGAR